MSQRLMLIASTFARFACTILSGIILSRGYPKTEFGTFMQGALWLSTITEVISIGMPKAILYFSGRERNSRNAIYHCLLIVSVLAIMGALLTWPAWGTVANLFSNPQLLNVLTWVALTLPFKVLNGVLSTALMQVHRIGWMTLITGTFSPLILVAYGACVFLHASLSTVFIVQLGLELAQFLIFLPLFLTSKSQGHWSFDLDLSKRILRYCSPLVLTIATLMVGKRLDSFFIASYFDPAAYAIYTRGALELPIGPLILFNISALLMPQIAKMFEQGKKTEINQLLAKEVGNNALLLFPVFFAMTLIYKEFIVFLYSQEYLASTGVFLVYLFLVPIQLYAFDTIVQAMNKSIWVTVSAGISIIVNLSVTLLTMPLCGPMAPALGMIASILANILVLIFIINHNLGVSFKLWLPWGLLARLLVLTGMPMLPLLLVKQLLPGPMLLSLFLYPSLYLGIVGALLWKSNLLPKEKLSALWPNNVWPFLSKANQN